jgi:hypothetical protein
VVDDAAPTIFAAVSKVHYRTGVKFFNRGESCSAFFSGAYDRCFCPVSGRRWDVGIARPSVGGMRPSRDSPAANRRCLDVDN